MICRGDDRKKREDKKSDPSEDVGMSQKIDPRTDDCGTQPKSYDGSYCASEDTLGRKQFPGQHS